MDVYVLFGEEWKRQVGDVRRMLEDIKVDYKFYDTTSNTTSRAIMWGLTGSGQTPILFINGVKYSGISEIRNQLA